MLQVLCPGEAFKLGPLESRDGGSAERRWMEARSRRKQGSSSICATVCDRPVLLLLSPGDPCRGARGGVSRFTLPIYHRPWPRRLCVFFSQRPKKGEENNTKGSAPPRLPTGGRSEPSQQVTSEISGFLSLEGSRCGASLGGQRGCWRVKVSQRWMDQKIGLC